MRSPASRHACSELTCARIVWKPRKADEVVDHLTTYPYSSDWKGSAKGNISTLNALYASLRVREDVRIAENSHTEYPFHGLLNEVLTRPEFHNEHICVSIRSPTKNKDERLSEETASDQLTVTGISHFAFFLDSADIYDQLASQPLDQAAVSLWGQL